MLSLLRRLTVLLNADERRFAYALLGLSILAGFIDVLGVSSILPFMAVVGNPKLVDTNWWLHNLYTRLNFESGETFLIGLGIAALIVMICSIVVSLAVTAAILWFSNNLGHNLAMRILSFYVRQPYAYFLDQNTSNLVVHCTDDINRAAQGVVIPTLRAIAKAIVAMCILLLVIWIDPWLAVLFGTIIGGSYAVVFMLSRQTVAKLGAAARIAHRERVRLATEFLNGIKELKVLGNEKAYQSRFAKHSRVYVRNQWISAAMSSVPRYAIESVAFGSMILLVIYLLATHRDFKDVLPLMALYAFTGYRVIPALQEIFAAGTQARFHMSSLRAVEDKIEGHVEESDEEAQQIPVLETPRFLRPEIKLQHVFFQYASASAPQINNLSLTIQPRTTVAIVGSSGAGKTTIVDIILGLLEPQGGSLLVDGTRITSRNVKAWQSHVGYVPQQIYLADDTLAANIAFGVAHKDVDMERVITVAQIAHLQEFARYELPNGYETMLGERGVRLSGGQRQRIGIARALYHNPDVLIFDEATSALDGITEDAVNEAMREMFRKKTIIIVAHRLRTVQQADLIYLLENGYIADQGTYGELLEKNTLFREMAIGVPS